jgi:hypothetical protein
MEREGVGIELDQLRTAGWTNFLVLVGEQIEFAVHSYVAGFVDGVVGERGVNVVPHGAPP